MSVKLVEPRAQIISDINGQQILKHIEKAGRTCYKSEDLTTDQSAEKFIKMIIQRGHESVLQHHSVSVRFVVDRGVSHEIVRHRIASFSQQSTRYCNYSKDKFDHSISVVDIRPHLKNKESFEVWLQAVTVASKAYNKMIQLGQSPQIARSVLSNSLKTEIVVTCNLRQWRLIFKQRTSSAAHPQMRQVMIPLLKQFQQVIPIVFDDIK